MMSVEFWSHHRSWISEMRVYYQHRQQ